MTLVGLRNIGPAALKDLALLGITTREQLASCDPDSLYQRLCVQTGQHHDPCVHDVFSAAIHQSLTGEALDWWHFSTARKARQRNGVFVATTIKTRK